MRSRAPVGRKDDLSSPQTVQHNTNSIWDRGHCDVQGVVYGEVGKSYWEEWETMLPELTLQYDGPAEARDLKASVVPTCPGVDSCSTAWCREAVGGEGGWRSAEGQRARILRPGTKRRAGRSRKGGP